MLNNDLSKEVDYLVKQCHAAVRDHTVDIDHKMEALKLLQHTLEFVASVNLSSRLNGLTGGMDDDGK